MINIQKILSSARNFGMVVTLLFIMAQCAEDETLLLTPPEVNDSVAETVPSSEEKSLVFSLTISGIHVVMSESAVCSTCTFVVPATTHLIDGTVLNLKPGSIICLDKAIEYGMLEFENLQGTMENPITIAYCGN